MGEQRNRWNWEVSGFEPRKPSSSSFEQDDQLKPGAPLIRRYSISSSSASPRLELSKHSLVTKVQRLNDKVKVLGFNSQLLPSTSSSFFLL